MSTLDQLRSRFNETWNHVTEGWQHLHTKAAHALTYFKSRPAGDSLETTDEQVMKESSRWALLSADVWTTDDAVIVSMEIPGMDRNDFDITVFDDHLVVRGTKHVHREGPAGRYHTIECAYGEFERAVALPEEVDQQKAGARYQDGVLRVTLPRTSRQRKRRITIETDQAAD